MPSIRTLLRGNRKYPILLALALLLLLLLLDHLSSSPSFSTASRFFSSYYSSNPLSSTPPPPPPPSFSPPPPSPPPPTYIDSRSRDADGAEAQVSDGGAGKWKWKICAGLKKVGVVDYIPCLDNAKAIKVLKSRRRMEHRERYCPKPSPQCLLPLPTGYKVPVPWPRSRDQIWFNNVPHSKLVDYKKDQNWVRISGEYFVFPGGGTQFKEGVMSYIEFIEKIFPTIEWGGRTRVILDVGCGVASFGGYLLDRDVISMSFAPKDEHEAQIQFALERGIPAVLSVIATRRLPFPDNSYDLIHCARCRVHWDGDGGKPLLELNRILRPGGFFVWSATPVYRDDERDQEVWNAMVALTESICWKTVKISTDVAGIGIVIYQKPFSNSCYERRRENSPPTCDPKSYANNSWYTPLDGCIPKIPDYKTGEEENWPSSWPERLSSRPLSLEYQNKISEDHFHEDTKQWITLVSTTYMHALAIDWSNIRNVMDMNAGYGGFAAALFKQPLWVMNTVPVNGPDTLPVVFDRGLIGIYHDWCESFNTYPRTYDLLHASYFFGNLTQRCNIIVVVAEMDRILRPGGWILVQEGLDTIQKLLPLFQSLHWNPVIHENMFLVGRKGFWRPGN